MSRKSKGKNLAAGRGQATDPFGPQIVRAAQFESQGNLEAAYGIYRQILAEAPQHSHVNIRLVTLLTQAGQFEAAAKHCANILESNKNNIFALTVYADCMSGLSNYEEAIQYYERAIGQFGGVEGRQLRSADKAQIYYRLGNIYGESDLYESAKRMLVKAAELDPEFAGAYCVLGSICSAMGESDQAITYFRKAIELNPLLGRAHKGLAHEKKHLELDSEVEAMQELFDSGRMALEDKTEVAFALGKAYEELGDYKKAFKCFSEGNRLHRSVYAYDIAEDLSNIETLRLLYKPEYAKSEAIGAGQLAGITPVLIVGMPRTGSSLLEQMLSSHSLVHGIGESDAAFSLLHAASKGDLRNLSSLGPADWRQMGEEYLSLVSKNAGGKPFVVDKMLSNFQCIGLMRMMCPQAKIINCRREAMDVALSAYKNAFKKGSLECSYDLEDFGALYRRYDEVMKYWRKTLPGWVYDLDYEDLIADPEKELRSVLSFIGLEFEESCLSFYKTKRVILTASMTQVRQPVYKSSVNLWKRYEKELQPFKKAYKGSWFGFLRK